MARDGRMIQAEIAVGRASDPGRRPLQIVQATTVIRAVDAQVRGTPAVIAGASGAPQIASSSSGLTVSSLSDSISGSLPLIG